MATLTSLMLDVAHLVGSVREGTATGGSTTTLVDSTLVEERGEVYAGGTLFFLSGANIGKSAVILSHASGGTLTFATLAATVAGDRYALAKPLFTKHQLLGACKQALSSVKLLMVSETLTTVANQEEYTLPAGVSDVRRVLVATQTVSPYRWEIQFNWEEYNGKIVFDPNTEPSTGGYKIRLLYAGQHPDLVEAGTILTDNLPFLRWQAAAALWRKVMQSVHKDNPIATEMANEAKTFEQEARRAYRLPARDPHLGAW